MGNYYFEQFCRPRGDFRIKEIIDFLDLMKEAFGLSKLFDSENNPIELTEGNIKSIFENILEKSHFKDVGIDEDFFTIPPDERDDDTIRIEIHTGTHLGKNFNDTYNISIGEKRNVPDFIYFKKSIEIFKPFEAYISEFKNENALNAYDRQQEIPNFDKPVIIRGFHYLDKDLASSVGGIERCLKAPAWKVERFCEGVLIQLTEGLFDPENPDHIKIQKEVMKYLKV